MYWTKTQQCQPWPCIPSKCLSLIFKVTSYALYFRHLLPSPRYSTSLTLHPHLTSTSTFSIFTTKTLSYIYIHISNKHIYIYIHIYIYLYLVFTYKFTHAHTHTHIYIYICVHFFDINQEHTLCIVICSTKCRTIPWVHYDTECLLSWAETSEKGFPQWSGVGHRKRYGETIAFHWTYW